MRPFSGSFCLRDSIFLKNVLRVFYASFTFDIFDISLSLMFCFIIEYIRKKLFNNKSTTLQSETNVHREIDAKRKSNINFVIL